MVREDDGSYILYHPNRQIEKEMDSKYNRWPNERRWSPKRAPYLVEDFKDIHIGKKAAIVGKGPSLDNLSIRDFGDVDVVFCCNDSIHKIVALSLKLQLYSVQLDTKLRDTCVSNYAIHFISDWAKDWAPNAVVLNTNWNKKLLTAVEAILLAKFMGIKDFKLLAFDAFNGNTNYANCIGYTPGRNPERFLEHKAYIEAAML